MNNHLFFTIFWYPQDQSWVCIAPQYPGLSAVGATPQDAMREMEIVLRVRAEVDVDLQNAQETALQSVWDHPDDAVWDKT